MHPRAPLESEIDPLAELWRASWHDAHAGLLPAAIVRHRTLEDFTERLRCNLANVREVRTDEGTVGFDVWRYEKDVTPNGSR